MNGGQLISNSRPHEVVIQRRKDPVADIDGFEGEDDWEDYYTNSAYINNLYGNERWQAAQVQSDKVVRFTFRWHPPLDGVKPEEYRIVYGGKPHVVTYVDNVEYKNETVKIDTFEVLT